MQTNQITMHAPINKLSYGIVSRNLIKELDKQNVEISLFPIGQTELEFSDEVELINRCLTNANTFPYGTAIPHLRLFHQFSLAERVGKGPLFGFPIFELDDFTDLERHHLEYCDGIIVASEWAKQVILEKTNIKKVSVCPLGADPSIFKPIEIPKDDVCRFLVVGKIELRKLHDLIPQIFAKAFSKEDDVELIMLWKNFFLSKEEEAEWIKYYKNSTLGHKIKILDRLPNSTAINELYNKVDCLLSISRAEGACLPAIECLHTGTPIIACNYSGITQYLNKNNSYLVDIDGFEQGYDGKFFIPGAKTNGKGQWATFGKKQIEQTVEYMRKIYKNKKEGLEYTRNYNQFTWGNSARRLKDIIFKLG